MADKLMIHDLTVQCRLGVSEAEQAQPQSVWVDLKLNIDAAKAAHHDDVREAIDYAALVESIRECVESKPYRLLETMAEDLAALILEHFATDQVTVRVKKRALPGIDYAAVEVERER